MSEERHCCWKNLIAFFKNENMSVGLHFRIISHNLKLYIKMKEMNTF